MIRVLLTCALLALASPSYAATQALSCQDVNGSDWPASPQHPCPTADGMLRPVAGSQEALGVVTATAMTIPAGATIASVTVEGQPVRWRCDGTAPTASAGSLLAVGSVTVFRINGLSSCQFIQTAATATLDFEYFSQ
jgi:hypothetical protein